MIVKDEELRSLNFERQSLIRRFDKNIIDEEAYNERIGKVNERINEKIKILLEEEKDKIKQNQEDKIKMSEEEKPKKIGRKPRADSNASILTKILMKKSVKNVDQALEEFDQVKPGNNPKNTRAQIKGIIRHVKKGNGLWAKYTWNEEDFQLTPKE